MSKDKTDRIFIRVSPTEKKKIEEKAKQVNRTVAGYLLSLSESRRIIDTTKMASLIVEIRKIGVNINQIAAVANTQKYVNKECRQRSSNTKKKYLTSYKKFLRKYMTRRNTLLRKWNTLLKVSKRKSISRQK